MKSSIRPLSMLFCLLFLTQFVSPEEKKPFKRRFSLKLAAGFASAGSMGDVNDALESFNNNEIFDSLRKANSDRLIGQIETLGNKAFDCEAELRFDLTPRIGFGVGVAAPFHAHNESTVTYKYSESNTLAWTLKPEVKTFFSIRLSAYYTLSFIPKLSISVGGGVGIYPSKIAQIRILNSYYPDRQYTYTIDQEAKRIIALGYHGTVALEYALSHRFSIIAEFQTRHVRISSLKGNEKGPDVWGGQYDVNGTLYYYSTRSTVIHASYALLRIFEEPVPDEPTLVGLREAVLDLSGFSLRMGLRIKLS